MYVVRISIRPVWSIWRLVVGPCYITSLSFWVQPLYHSHRTVTRDNSLSWSTHVYPPLWWTGCSSIAAWLTRSPACCTCSCYALWWLNQSSNSARFAKVHSLVTTIRYVQYVLNTCMLSVWSLVTLTYRKPCCRRWWRRWEILWRYSSIQIDTRESITLESMYRMVT